MCGIPGSYVPNYDMKKKGDIVLPPFTNPINVIKIHWFNDLSLIDRISPGFVGCDNSPGPAVSGTPEEMAWVG